MHTFSYVRADDIDHALRLAAEAGSRFIAGGTNLLDLWKSGIERPLRLVDLGRLPLAGIDALPDGGVRIGALASNTDAANHALIRQRYPLLSAALLAGASQQLRNMASVGGNLLQRTRCHYFVDPAFEHCNKRRPGSGCAAIDGHNRTHAILGASEACIAVHPSDMAVALCALDAVVQVKSMQGERTIHIGDFHRLPGDTPETDTTLAPGELIVSVDLPPSPFAAHSVYLKLRDRASYAFALVSVAAALDMDNGVVRSARIALGGVAHAPWRASDAETALHGKVPSDDVLDAAAAAALSGARACSGNAYKIELARRAVVRAVRTAAAKQGERP